MGRQAHSNKPFRMAVSSCNSTHVLRGPCVSVELRNFLFNASIIALGCSVEVQESVAFPRPTGVSTPAKLTPVHLSQLVDTVTVNTGGYFTLIELQKDTGRDRRHVQSQRADSYLV